MLIAKTSPEAAKLILKNGFKLGFGGIAGGGIYFSLSEEDAKGRTKLHGAILKCDVDVGKTKIMKQYEDQITKENLEKQGFDSVYFPEQYMGIQLKKPKFAIYDPNRVKSIEII
ncbi:MAG: hypothetical protein EZS28_009906 [Streblomastix strix]|uniref:PARP catalytic domain-containing protein n=1 Tax=Streblomastix strix TaxID=222440 RepID=A0A5J4WIB6_9EUKA|nr:MAG: hypothetical protein EZS28_009906 [Streblomastix strix]